MDRDALRGLPPVGAVLEHEALADSCAHRGDGRRCFARCGRRLRKLDAGCAAGGQIAVDPQSLAGRSLEILDERAGEPAACDQRDRSACFIRGWGERLWQRKRSRPWRRWLAGYCSLELELEDGGARAAHCRNRTAGVRVDQG